MVARRQSPSYWANGLAPVGRRPRISRDSGTRCILWPLGVGERSDNAIMPAVLGADAPYNLFAGRPFASVATGDALRSSASLAGTLAVDRSRIGVVGLGLGGEIAMLTAVLDERVGAIAIASGLADADLGRTRPLDPLLIPSEGEWFTQSDLAAALAPRALYLSWGTACSPSGEASPAELDEIRAEALGQTAAGRVRTAYEAVGASSAVTLVVHEYGHILDVDSLEAFLGQTVGSLPANVDASRPGGQP